MTAGIPFSRVAASAAGALFLALSFFTDPELWPGDPAWVSVMLCGAPIAWAAVIRLVRGKGISKISSDALITLAMAAAVFIGDVFAAGEVAFIMSLGEMLELATRAKARRGLSKLIGLSPAMGRIVEKDGKARMFPVEEIAAGDILRVLPGERIPADAEILTGETAVDQSVLTGESLPVDKLPGDAVLAGTMNGCGAFDARVTRAASESSLSQMIRLMKEAEEKKGPAERMIDRAASWLVPAALAVALLVWFVTGDITRGVTVLVVFCPCALVLATPTAIIAAIGQATKRGILIKSGEALEKMDKVTMLAMDKTGTITEGTLEVASCVALRDGLGKEDVLALAGAAEEKSTHPLARAVMDYAEKMNVTPAAASDFHMKAGRGISVETKMGKLFCGSVCFMKEMGITISSLAEKEIEKRKREGKALICVADRRGVLGLLGLSDTLRPCVKATVTRLTKLGVGTALLTGDHEEAARYMADEAGIETVYAELLPEEKVLRVRELSETDRVAMVGDGINDAPAMKAASVGIAMARQGADITADAADVVFMRDDISDLYYMKRLARETAKTIRRSITLSMAINLAAVVLAACGLLGPTVGAIVHNAGSVLVIALAAGLYGREIVE